MPYTRLLLPLQEVSGLPARSSTALRFFHNNNSNNNDDKSNQGKRGRGGSGEEATDPKTTREDGILERRQKLYQTNTTCHDEAGQLRKQPGQEGKEVMEESPKAAVRFVQSEQRQQPRQQDGEEPASSSEAAVAAAQDAETATIEELVEKATQAMSRIRELAAKQDQEIDDEPSGETATTTDEELDKIEAVLESIAKSVQDQGLSHKGREAVPRWEMTTNEARLFRGLDRSKADMAEMSHRLDAISKGLEEVEGLTERTTKRITSNEERDSQRRILKWDHILHGASLRVCC
ncbi:hypothetical protein QBC36DRAFT_307378 [Triangularia setosa]|uniref:Uncharacterized protein n=1 Tax=Triangularia setosa TaxID=2587417 RepID=A0AAN7AC71_9PEZI|nr:hypothetical protein QBC36DRAFT_307378 [Podospora setosa]